MKKLLSIVVLSLLLSGNAYAKTIKCDNNYNNGTSIFTYDTNGINSEAKYFDDVSFVVVWHVKFHICWFLLFSLVV